MIGINIPAPMPTDLPAERLAALIALATEVATKAHAGQTRKFTGEPYVTHPLAVASLVEPALKPVAILHDVVEDTKVTEGDLRRQFPEWVVDRVMLLTKKEGETYDAFIMRAGSDDGSRKVKKADIQHNMSTLKPGGLMDKYRLAHMLLTFMDLVTGLVGNVQRLGNF